MGCIPGIIPHFFLCNINLFCSVSSTSLHAAMDLRAPMAPSLAPGIGWIGIELLLFLFLRMGSRSTCDEIWPVKHEGKSAGYLLEENSCS